MKKNIVIIHYNTPYLTECLVRSINLFVKDAVIYIFDNSDKDPFVAKFDNVSIIDNTKGQIINFDEWLKNYPNRISSGGKCNLWGSAKHCYSVEKCMELLKENFILMDSDVLLKKDISLFFQDDCIYVGETVKKKGSSVKRLLPFLCFINTKMCLENNIHYFNENYMLGLKKSQNGEAYDTGAFFANSVDGLKHLDLNISDYIVHFNNASWLSNSINKHSVTQEEWLNRYKKLYEGGKNKKVIYTCITGDYDNLIEPRFISDDFDYVCFTDSIFVRNGFWELRPLPKEVESLSQVKKQRYIKINAHKVLPEYDLSVWVDGSVLINNKLEDLLDNILENDISVYVPTHPIRNCIYKEANTVISSRKDIKDIVNPQIEQYKKEGFPKEYGLLQSNILIRKHNNEDCIRLMEAWSNEVMNGSHRDQLSFNYCCWKNPDIKVKYIDKYIYKSKWFTWGSHKRKVIRRIPRSNKTPLVPSRGTPKNDRIATAREKLSKILNNRRVIHSYDVRIY